jgi:hypothetical protein
MSILWRMLIFRKHLSKIIAILLLAFIFAGQIGLVLFVKAAVAVTSITLIRRLSELSLPSSGSLLKETSEGSFEKISGRSVLPLLSSSEAASP